MKLILVLMNAINLGEKVLPVHCKDRYIPSKHITESININIHNIIG